MYRVRQQDLPFRGSSHEFIGAEQGDVGISVFLLSAQPGKGRDRTVIHMMKCSS